jgi:2-polyprenyl-3-methyl-5-hydroxy-6-metoxy-1,4-benzoquinol methylase
LGESDIRVANIDGVQRFRCRIEKFDAETDRYPCEDGRFDTVLACEIIEHLQRDPMHLLLESRRVLVEGGALLLTTPNCASLASVARALKGENPQVFAQYSNPLRGEQRGAHVREYTPWEIEKL